MSDETAIQQIRDDVNLLTRKTDEIHRWTESHDRRHVTEDDRLNLLLEFQAEHSSNHHGKGTMVKQSAAVAAIVTILGALGELTGLLDLLRLLPSIS